MKVTMTNDQHKTLTGLKLGGFTLLGVMTDEKGFGLLDPYWFPLSEEQFAYAWLYPERVTIAED